MPLALNNNRGSYSVYSGRMKISGVFSLITSCFKAIFGQNILPCLWVAGCWDCNDFYILPCILQQHGRKVAWFQHLTRFGNCSNFTTKTPSASILPSRPHSPIT